MTCVTITYANSRPERGGLFRFMKEFSRHPDMLNAGQHFTHACTLVGEIQRFAAVDKSTYRGILTGDEWGDDGYFITFETVQHHRPLPEQSPLTTTIAVNTPEVRGEIKIEADWINTHARFAFDPWDDQSDVSGAMSQLETVLTELNPHRSFDPHSLTYHTLDWATVRSDETLVCGVKNETPTQRVRLQYNRSTQEAQRVSLDYSSRRGQVRALWTPTDYFAVATRTDATHAMVDIRTPEHYLQKGLNHLSAKNQRRAPNRHNLIPSTSVMQLCEQRTTR